VDHLKTSLGGLSRTMVAGDVVNGVFDPVTLMVFQPAATVECVITSASCNGQQLRLTDGVTSVFINITNVDTNTKIMINNSVYLSANAAAVGWGSSFSGIQIK
jgi:hypothetical protein